MIDLDDLEQRYVRGWGERMRVGVEVREMRELLLEVRAQRERLRLQKAQIESLEVQCDFWERACARLTREVKRRLTPEVVQAYGDRMYAEGQCDEFGDGKAEPPPEPGDEPPGVP